MLEEHTTHPSITPSSSPGAYLHSGESHVNRVPGLPNDAYWEMINASIELLRQDATEAKAYQDGLREAGQEFMRQLHGIIGGAHLPGYLAAQRTQIQALRDARRKGTFTREGAREFEATRRALVDQARTYVQSLGVDVAQVRRLQADAKKKMADLFSQTVGKGEEAARHKARAKNQTFTPPFSLPSQSSIPFRFPGDPSDNLPEPTSKLFVDSQTGEIGSTTSCSVSDASDYDKASMVTRTGMQQWYKMPTEGQVRVSSRLEVINSNISGSVYDEWGWSSIDLRQKVRYYGRVTSPKVSPRVYYAPLEYLNQVTDEDAPDWSRSRWDVGESEGILSQIVLPGVFKKDTWVLVDVGVENVNWFLSNDVTVTSHQTAHYWTREIGISSTGG